MQLDILLYNGVYQSHFTNLVLTIIYDCLVSGKHAVSKVNHSSSFYSLARQTSINSRLANADGKTNAPYWYRQCDVRHVQPGYASRPTLMVPSIVPSTCQLLISPCCKPDRIIIQQLTICGFRSVTSSLANDRTNVLLSEICFTLTKMPS